MKILIIKLAATGDVLRTTSVLPGLKGKYSDADIHWLTQEYPAQLLKNNPYISRIFIASKGHDLSALKKIGYDLVISLDEDHESCRLASEITKKEIIGAYLKENKVIYTKNSSGLFDMGLISIYGKEKADLLKKQNKKTYQEILCDILKIDNSKPVLILGKEELKFAESFAKDNSINKEDLTIGLNTSAGKRWQLKALPLQKTIKLIEKINSEFKSKIILFGGPEEQERNQKIVSSVSEKIIDAGCNNSLTEFAALINLCDIVITSDSLALHIGAALNKKVIAFFGPTSSAEIDLCSKGKKISADMNCLCCYKKECDKKPNCMEEIGIDKIIKSIKELK